VINNTATVNYNDAGGNAQAPVSASATATVTLIPSALNISSPANQSISQGTPTTLTYVITGTANGPDTYNLSLTDAPTNETGTGAAVQGANPITLGGTTLAAAAPIGATTITVPYDQNASTASLNGLGAGSVVVIGGNPYTIAAAGINKTSSATSNTVVLTLTTAIAGTAGTAGQIVPQQLTVTVNVPSGSVTSGSSGTQTVTLTGTSNTAPNPAASQGTPTVVTTNRPVVTLTKLVSSDNGATFAATSSAPPGTSLIYKVTATNGGTTNATTVQFTDVVPKFLTYVAGSAKLATSSATAYASATALTEGSGGYTFTAATGTVAYNPGGATGTVAGSGVLVLFFRATIN
jgi:uncharacterized repeat protein (TIGR01451 family)